MIVIGITGTLGAGKGTVVEYLKTKGFAHYSASGFITREIERRGLPVNRDNMNLVARDLRTIHSPSYIAETLCAEAEQNGKDAIIEALHTEGEVQALREKGNFILLAIDADQEIRYKRIVSRGSAKDNISFEKFRADEAREMHATDPTQQNLARCIELADYQLLNNDAKEALHARVDDVLNTIKENSI